MITSEQLKTILAFGTEQRGVEFKAQGSLKDAHFRARVVRAVLGMANRRDGGLVVLGVDDGDPPSSAGMADASLVAEWTNYDDVADQIDRYADPGVEFTIDTLAYGAASFVVVQVDEFLDQPVICQKAYQAPGGQLVLRRGAVYIRSSTGKIETREVLDASEMREVLNLATEKRLRSHIETTARAGGMIVTSEGAAPPSVAQQFASELGDLG